MRYRVQYLALGLSLIGFFGAAPALAQHAPVAGPIADVIAGAGRLDFVPRQGGEGFVLTVSGPDGAVERMEFESGRPVMFTLSGPDGGTRPDGVYTYELRARRPAPAAIAGRLSGVETIDGRAGEVESSARSRTSAENVPLSGSFWIQSGRIIAGGSPEPRVTRTAPSGSSAGRSSAAGRAALDVVNADDFIVQGSACVGIDCVDGEVFGFHTIRLKENNTRLGFVDTSVGAFAANDWVIQANGSGSGAANYLGFVDQGPTGGETGSEAGTLVFQVNAGAPASSLVVDSSGRVGFRTATPVLDLHANTGDTPALRMEQNSGSGFTAQTWDIAGNEANFFVRDVTGGSRLPFRIRPGAPTSSIDISATGNVGIGTGSPGGPLHIFGIAGKDVFAGMGPDLAAGPAFNFGYGGFTFGRGAGFLNVRPDAAAVAPNPSLRFMTANVQRMIITNVGNVGIGVANPSNPLEMASGARCTAGGVWTNASSREYKENIEDLSPEAAEETLARLNPVTYRYKVAPSEHHVGFIAEDVPEMVATPDRRGLSSMDIVGVLTKVVQEQQKTIKELSERLARIELSPTTRP